MSLVAQPGAKAVGSVGSVTENDNEPLPDTEWFTWRGDMGPVPLVRRAREYIDSLHYVAEALLSMSQSIADKSITRSIRDKTALTHYLQEAITADTGFILRDLDSARPENMDEAVATASRDGIAGLTPVQLLIVVLVWLLAFGTSLIQQTLPPEAQSVVSGDIGTAGLALAITTLIIQQRRR
jgi:hypothetical protein